MEGGTGDGGWGTTRRILLRGRGRLVALIVALLWGGVAVWLWARQLQVLCFGALCNVGVAFLHVLMVHIEIQGCGCGCGCGYVVVWVCGCVGVGCEWAARR